MLLDGAKRSGGLTETETKAKVKFDRQILAVAKVMGAGTIYTNDGRLAKLSRLNGIKPIAIHELPLPPVDQQGLLALEETDDD